jgi:hypothetical protein
MPESDPQAQNPPTVPTETPSTIPADMIIDIMFLAGLVFIFLGLGLAVGWGWGLVAVGVILTGTGLWLGGKK